YERAEPYPDGQYAENHGDESKDDDARDDDTGDLARAHGKQCEHSLLPFGLFDRYFAALDAVDDDLATFGDEHGIGHNVIFLAVDLRLPRRAKRAKRHALFAHELFKIARAERVPRR